jgi:hypothetical protein
VLQEKHILKRTFKLYPLKEQFLLLYIEMFSISKVDNNDKARNNYSKIPNATALS